MLGASQYFQRKAPYGVALLIIMAVWLFCRLSGLLGGWGEWHNPDTNYLFQVDALMRGQLSLSSRPVGHAHDWVWGNGLHQIWGLGVPFLIVPFEALGRSLGSPFAPINLVFCFYVVATVIFFLWAAKHFIHSESGSPYATAAFCLTALAIFFLNRGFFGVISSRFQVYEQAAAFSYLAAVLLFSFSFLASKTTSPPLIVLMCALTTAALWIRPTLLFAAAATLTFLLPLLWIRGGIKSLAFGLAAASAPMLGLFATNIARFGKPLEFGHLFGLSSNSLDFYSVRLGSPLQSRPWLELAQDLVWSLFFSGQYPRTSRPTLTERLRSYEFNFPTLDQLDFWFVTLACVVFAFYIVMRIRTHRRSFFKWWEMPSLERGYCISVVWSVFVFVPLFALTYLRWPRFASRYALDFLPAISAMTLSLAIAAIRFSEKAHSARASALFGWLILSLTLGRFLSVTPHTKWTALISGPSEGEKERWVEREETIRNIEQRQSELDKLPHYAPPSHYQCHGSPTPDPIPFNKLGWDYTNTCRVSIATQLFLPKSPCIELTVRSTTRFDEVTSKTPRVLVDYDIFNLEHVRRVLDTWTCRHCQVLRYCRDADASSPIPNRSVSLVTIGWIEKEEITAPMVKGCPERPKITLPIQLEQVRVL